MKIVNIIPTYNEKENIGPMLQALNLIAKKLPQHQFATLVVDDLSPDGTSAIVKQRMKKDRSIFLMSAAKRGLGNALLRGYLFATNQLKAEVIIPNDCDFSWNPQDITKLLAKIATGYDVVIASRHGRGSQTNGWSKFRRLNHWISNVLFATYLAGIKEVYDHNGNFKAIKVKGVLDKVPLSRLLRQLTVQGFAFQPYILYELSRITNKFCEVPVTFRFRLKGESKIGYKYFKIYLKDTLEYMKLCFLIRMKRFNSGHK